MSDGVDFPAAEELLRTAEFESVEALWSSSNYVFAARMCGPDGGNFAAIYKPRRGESPLWDFPDGTLYRREVAAYELSKLLGWPFVPPTVVREEGPHGVGSLQVYIPHDESSHFFEQRDIAELAVQLQRMAVFDFVANNADRKGGHCLLDAEGKIWGIDHGLCFHEQYKMRTVIWDWAEERIPDEWLEDVGRAVTAMREKREEAAAFMGLVAKAEWMGVIGRGERLMKTRTYPKPGPHRHYPWPLV